MKAVLERGRSSAILCTSTALLGLRQTLFMGACRFKFIVGYLGNDMKASGFDMAAGSFASVSASNGSCTLADFTVSGYEAPVWDDDEEDYVGGCPGSFVVQFLSSSGTTEATYYWVDNGEVAPGWYTSKGGAAISGGAASVSIAAGQAMWIQGRGMKLVSAGAVNEEDIAFPTRASGFNAVHP